MLPEINIGPIMLQTFGTMFALGFIAAAVLVSLRLKELGKRPDYAYEMIAGGLVWIWLNPRHGSIAREDYPAADVPAGARTAT